MTLFDALLYAFVLIVIVLLVAGVEDIREGRERLYKHHGREPGDEPQWRDTR